jgi:hypothetical protein
MDAATAAALVSAGLATIIAVTVPWMTFRLALRQDAIRWLREQRAQLYVDMLTEAQAEYAWLQYALADDTARERMAPHFQDLRLAPLERARLAARATVLGSRAVNRVFSRLMTEGGRALLNLNQLDSEALQMLSRVQLGGIVDELEAAVRLELGADRIPLGAAAPVGSQAQDDRAQAG